jgi:hypothetical protein
VSQFDSSTVSTVGSDVDAEKAVKPVVMLRPYTCWMAEVSVVLAVPGVELVAFVDRTTSQNTGTAVAVTPSKPIRNFFRSPPNDDGVITISAVFAVAADRATAAVVRTVYPALAICQNPVHIAVASRTSAERRR